MPEFADYSPAGVIPATLMAFHDDFRIDEFSARKHLADVANVAGIDAITINGHASEVHACTSAEQQRILNFSLDEVGDRLPIINGVYADGSLHAAEIARMAESEGASALLVFPPNSMSMGGSLRPEMALTHFKMIADATSLPLIVFQYPVATGLAYPLPTLLDMADQIPSIKAVKDWCNDPALHELQTTSLQGLSRPVTMLTTHSTWLLASLSMGANGLLSGAGSVLADLQVALFSAIKRGDLQRAQVLNDTYRPVVQSFYTAPFLDMHNRMKECLVLLGRLPAAVVRPPLMKISAHERAHLSQVLKTAGITRDGALANAA